MEIKFRIAHISDLHFSANAGHINLLAESGGHVDDNGMMRKAIKNAMLKDLKGAASDFFWGDGDELRKIKSRFSPYVEMSSYEPDAAISFLRAIRGIPDIDAVISTGDLATSGDCVDLRVAHDYFNGKFNGRFDLPLSDNLESLVDGKKLFLMPGNHDRYDANNFYSPNCGNFEKIFGQNWDMELGQLSPAGDSSGRIRLGVLSKDNHHVVVIMADFSLKSQDKFKINSSILEMRDDFIKVLGKGRACEIISKDLISITKSMKSLYDGCCVVWALHFPPVSEDRCDSLELIGGRDLIVESMNQDAHPNVIISGHTHKIAKYDLYQDKSFKKIKYYNSGSLCGAGVDCEYNFNVMDICYVNNSWEFHALNYKYEYGDGFDEVPFCDNRGIVDI